MMFIDLRKGFDSVGKWKFFDILQSRCKLSDERHIVHLIERLH